MPEDITLEQWTAKAQKHLTNFVIHWQKKMAEKEPGYENEMWPGDWWENFGAYVEGVEDGTHN